MKPIAENTFALLQNIEFQIVNAYRSNPAITDYDVTDALTALTRHFSAEAAERQPSAITLDPRAEDVYQNVREICEWQMGRTPDGGIGAPASLQDIIAALRKITNSIPRWSQRGGKRGYLDFVKEYLP